MCQNVEKLAHNLTKHHTVGLIECSPTHSRTFRHIQALIAYIRYFNTIHGQSPPHFYLTVSTSLMCQVGDSEQHVDAWRKVLIRCPLTHN